VSPKPILVFVAIVLVAMVGAAVFLTVYRFEPILGCTKTLRIHASNIQGGGDAENVPLYLALDGRPIGQGATDHFGNYVFVSVPCGHLGLTYGGDNWVLYPPIVVDTTTPGTTVWVNIAVAICGSGDCGR